MHYEKQKSLFAGTDCVEVFLIFLKIQLIISMKNIKNESLKLGETAHDSNVIPVMNNYDPCGPECRPPMPISPPLWSSDVTLTLGCWVTIAARKVWTLS